MKRFNFLMLLLLPLILASGCKKDSEDNNGTGSAVLGDVGNTWSATINGNAMSARILSNDDGLIRLVVDMGGEKDTILVEFRNNRISEFVHTNGDLTKPFTMVEFDANVGDRYTLALDAGMFFQRDVIEKETYYIEALGKELPTIGVYEEVPSGLNLQLFGLYIEAIIWYWHPEYGLVCVDILTTDGQFIGVVFVQIEL